MRTLGILADLPSGASGFAVVCRNLANELSRWFRVIYFGRFGQLMGFAPETTLHGVDFFEYVPCQWGVWDRNLVIKILDHYKEIDYVFSEDDWYSAYGLVRACVVRDKPFHFLTPIDSLPVNPRAYSDIFNLCEKLYIPNRSYERYDGRRRLKFGAAGSIIERQGPNLKAVKLPHGVDGNSFYIKKVKRPEEFTFLWLGRIEPRKAPGRLILAFEKVCNKMDAVLHIRSDWSTPLGQKFLSYILKKNLPVKFDRMEDIPHHQMVDVYNMGDVNICTARAGGFEMSITEAAACGLPSLVTDWTFMNENMVHGKSGFLIPIEGLTYPPPPIPGKPQTSDLALNRMWGNISIDKLAEMMYWCYLNQREVKLMGRWARNYVVKTYNWHEVAKRLKNEILV